MNTNFRVLVIGGGVTGLATAHRLLELSRETKRPLDIKLIEASPRPGGVVATNFQDDFLLESGPDSFISEKPWALELCKRLGLEDQLIGTQPENRRSFIARGDRLLDVPEGFYLLAPSRLWPFVKSPIVSWPGKLRMAMDLVLPRKTDGAEVEESLEQFVTRRLGREALERVAQPMIGGIYTANPAELSLKAAMPRFLEMEAKHRSLILAMMRSRRNNPVVTASGPRYGLFVSFQRGMQTLTDALAARLPAGTIALNQSVRSIERAPHHWRVSCHSGRNDEVDAVVVAVPSPSAALLLDGVAPKLSAELNKTPYSSVATLNLAYRRDEIPHPLNGSGFVVPAVEKRAILACTFCSQKFKGRSPDGRVLLRVFLGGAMSPEQLECGDDTLIERVRGDLKTLLGVTAKPLLSDLHRYPQSMAQYHVGHLERVEKIRQLTQEHAGLFLAGNGYLGVGIPDCVHSGETAAEQIVQSVSIRDPQESSL